MLITDGRRLVSGNYDCFIIGSGPAGLTVALELGRAGRRVLVLETDDGGADFTASVGYGHFSGLHWAAHSIRALGGTSTIWTGWVTTLRDLDFDNPAAGAKWPISRSDLLPYYRQAATVLDRDESIVDFESALLPGFIYRPFSGERPTRFGEKYRDELARSPVVDVALGYSLVGIEANEGRSLLTRLHYLHHSSQVRRQLAIDPAQPVVIAAGGIGNAQLMLQPGPDGGVPVGNESGLAGRFLMEHPHYHNAAECVLDVNLDEGFRPGRPFGPSIHGVMPDQALSAERGLLACHLEFRRRSTDHEMARFFTRESGRLHHHYLLNVRTEMRPSAANHVFLTGERGRAGLLQAAARCVVDAGDLATAELTLRLLAETLLAHGKGRLRIDNDRIYHRTAGGGHIMGTTRMGADRSTSVVDAECRVHGYGNFFVAGSSVFPTGGYANPTLTIVALALRLAGTLSAMIERNA